LNHQVSTIRFAIHQSFVNVTIMDTQRNDQTQDKASTRSEPVLCLASCGFFGNPATNNYCSKCFRKQQQAAPASVQSPPSPVKPAALESKQGSVSSSSVVSPVVAPSPTPALPLTQQTQRPQPLPGASTSPAAASASSEAVSTPPKKKKDRCQICKIKLAIPFDCNCDSNAKFCAKHRYPFDHSCSYDWKQQTADQLAKANPKYILYFSP